MIKSTYHPVPPKDIDDLGIKWMPEEEVDKIYEDIMKKQSEFIESGVGDDFNAWDPTDDDPDFIVECKHEDRKTTLSDEEIDELFKNTLAPEEEREKASRELEEKLKVKFKPDGFEIDFGDGDEEVEEMGILLNNGVIIPFIER